MKERRKIVQIVFSLAAEDWLYTDLALDIYEAGILHSNLITANDLAIDMLHRCKTKTL